MLSRQFKRFASTKRVVVCPGQGQFSTGHLYQLSKFSNLPQVLKVLDEVDAKLPEIELSKYIRNPDKLLNDSKSIETLQKTSIQQPMLILSSHLTKIIYDSIYGIDLLKDANYMIGHSLGEITSLVLQDTIPWHKGVELAYNRGKLMENLIQDSPTTLGDKYSMQALLFQPTHFKIIIQELEKLNVNISNFNNYQQVVISGLENELNDKLSELRKWLADSKIWKTRIRAVDLNVSIPFHHPILQSIEPELTTLFNNATSESLGDLKIPVFSCLNGELTTDINTQIENIIKVTSKPVKFLNCLENFQIGSGGLLEHGDNVEFIHFGGSTFNITEKFYGDFLKLKKEAGLPTNYKNYAVDDMDTIKDLYSK
ncbi:hypothetical protein CANARDRAFT_10339 [[Candida] arabinofermentans NRRL YB-2248]|uniref:[acyl-carrier-protein] S-malonyltransferase n=1 Tax=[Candida] arabinofermentans NRRL YB-2248 TaxID=983967 RepID=A0A1E4ST51_9ASCO|nr:hypothetical protein CANARDRAFT_10339 [[Candida] arabinofermentans NRRL YB-2248]